MNFIFSVIYHRLRKPLNIIVTLILKYSYIKKSTLIQRVPCTFLQLVLNMCHQRVTEHSCSHRSIKPVLCALASSGDLIPHFTEPASFRVSRRKCESCEKDASLKQKARRETRAPLNHPDGLALNPYLRPRVAGTVPLGVIQGQQINTSLESTNELQTSSLHPSRSEEQNSSPAHQQRRVSPPCPDRPVGLASNPYPDVGASENSLLAGIGRRQINTTIGSIDAILAANPPQPNRSRGQGLKQQRSPQGRLPVMNRLIRHPSCLIPGLSSTGLLTQVLPSTLRTLRSLPDQARNQRSSSTRRGTLSAMQMSALYHSQNWQHSQRSQPAQHYQSSHPSQSSSHPQCPENTQVGSQRSPLPSSQEFLPPQIQLQNHFPKLCLEGKVALGTFRAALQNW